jgi:hypothetical protein
MCYSNNIIRYPIMINHLKLFREANKSQISQSEYLWMVDRNKSTFDWIYEKPHKMQVDFFCKFSLN